MVQADVMVDDLPGGPYDAVLSMSALHHLPLEQALRRLTAVLRPGGTFAAVALPRRDVPRELQVEAAATVWHRRDGEAVRRNPRRIPSQRRPPAGDHDLLL